MAQLRAKWITFASGPPYSVAIVRPCDRATEIAVTGSAQETHAKRYLTQGGGIMKTRVVFCILLAVVSISWSRAAETDAVNPALADAWNHAASGFDSVFVENRGQLDPGVQYSAQLPGLTVSLTSRGLTLELYSAPKTTSLQMAKAPPRDLSATSRGTSERDRVEWFGRTARKRPLRDQDVQASSLAERSTIHIDFVDANPTPVVEGSGPVSGLRNYYLGSDPRRWATKVHAFSAVTFKGLWPGVHLTYWVEGGALRYKYTGTNANTIAGKAFRYEGANRIVAGPAGSFHLETPLANVTDMRPAGDRDTGTIAVGATFEGSSQASPQIGGQCSNYPRGVTMMDLAYSTFFGPNSIGTFVNAVVAVPGQNGLEPLVVGTTADDITSSSVAFVAKFDLTASNLQWISYFGGTGDDQATSVALDGNQPLVYGVTTSTNFPTTPGVFRSTPIPGYGDLFLAKLTDVGELVWSTYVGGDVSSTGWALHPGAPDNSPWWGEYTPQAIQVYAHKPIIVGWPCGAGFTTPGAFDPVPDLPNGTDSFVAQLDENGSALAFGTCLANVRLTSLDLDALGAPVVLGDGGASFPTTLGAYDPVGPFANPICQQPPYLFCGPDHVAVAKLSADGSALQWGTFIGGCVDESTLAVRLDGAGNVVIAGTTLSPNFPVSSQPAQSQIGEGWGRCQTEPGKRCRWWDDLCNNGCTDCDGCSWDWDGFVARLSGDGSQLLSSTFLGGSYFDAIKGLELDGDGRPIVVGTTLSDDFPVDGSPWDPTLDQVIYQDAFVTKLEVDGTVFLASTLLGGDGGEAANGVALDYAGNPIVVGVTGWGYDVPPQCDFPTTQYAFQQNRPSDYSGFLTKLLPLTRCLHLVNQPGTNVTILMDAAFYGECPWPERSDSLDGYLYDVIEGRIENLSPTSIGPVSPLACDMSDVVLENESLPRIGHVLFLLARRSPGGSYTDSDGPGLVGTRQPSSGDCP